MAKKHLGQNFLFDPTILRKIVSAAGITPDDTVVEIGPGHGRLTRMLSEAAKKVIAIELDEDLYKRLAHELSGLGNIELAHEDALKYPYNELGRFKVAANIPYYITTPLIFKLLEHHGHLLSATMTMQKEIAERIVAKPGGREYGRLSIMVQYYGMPEIRFIVPRGAFRPVPKVDSAVVHISMYERPLVSVKNEGFFFNVVRTAFSHRRKTVLNALKGLSVDIKGKLLEAGIDPMRRPETMSIEEFARLSDIIKKAGAGDS